jgi:DNA-binding NtrC family response regulator
MESSQRRPYDRTSYILVVDDDDTLLKFFKIHLNKFFSRVIVVRNHKEAIETLRTKTIDLVITDFRMPGMDGTQLMKKIRKHDPSIPVLIISGALLNEETSEKCEKEADGFLRKPFTVEGLHGFIESGMQRREKLVRLSSFLTDKKSIRDVLGGKTKLNNCTEPDHLEEAKELLVELSAAS